MVEIPISVAVAGDYDQVGDDDEEVVGRFDDGLHWAEEAVVVG